MRTYRFFVRVCRVKNPHGAFMQRQKQNNNIKTRYRTGPSRDGEAN